jgi:aminopeptidase N
MRCGPRFKKERTALADQDCRYRREDFGELPVKLNHVTIYLNFIDDYVEATNVLDMTATIPLDRIELDAKNLEIAKVEWLRDGDSLEDSGMLLDFDYRRQDNKLIILLPHPVHPAARFRVRTSTRCFPSDNILEGIYKDATPPAAPQQYVSQCQQWGFQRIMPVYDDCRAKCTMTTTIEADARYTHLISNGNISRERNPERKPVPKPGDASRQIITYENNIPMAPYLFLVCVGTWDMLTDCVTYENGRTVQLEYLVPPGRAAHARIPMDILKQSVLWIKKTQNYEYLLDTYRTICMTKSNFGGMENMGNTTIVTDAALIDEHTLDQGLLYSHAVIVHEFEHNQCGSETTMETPFDVWLNEAYTVDVERQFSADLFNPTFIRLTQVDSIRNPLMGPLAIEDSGRAGRIVRDSFNDPDELIDGVTYVKAAEVIRMLRLILGKENFFAGKELYFSRYKNSNANTDQFFACFEEVSGRSLDLFKQGWLFRIGYPEVIAHTQYDESKKELSVHFSQDPGDSQPSFHIPIELALINDRGETIPGTESMFELKEKTENLVFQNIQTFPTVVSLNRDYSFYGTFRYENTPPEALRLQARIDNNEFNRVEAMRRLTDIQRIALLLNPAYQIEQEWVSLYGEILADSNLPPGLRIYLLRIEEQPLDRKYAAWFQELVMAKERLMLEVNRNFRNDLLQSFNKLDSYKPRESPRDGIEERILKNVLLDLIAIDDSAESHKLILEHYRSATTATDRVAALLALNRSSSKERLGLLKQAYDAWHEHVSGYANYLRIIGSGTRDDVFDMIETEKKRSSFDINQPTWVRALFLSMATNNKMVWTDRGIQWLANTVIELASINGYNASRLLNTFQQVRRLKPDLQNKVRSALAEIVDKVPRDISATVHEQAKSYLA